MGDFRVIEPKVSVIGFGPNMILEDGTIVTPDDFVYGAANITYRDTGALRELIESKRTNPDFTEEKVRKGLIKVAGAGHASMATTPGFWTFLEGDSSKLVDSTFTGAVFSSSLMPSGRRIQITPEAVLVPKGIAEAGVEAVEMYLDVSRANIQTYEQLQAMGMSKQEASKCVQYGHRGGGFMFMPLETFIYFSKLAERNPEAMPREGLEIISQIEGFIHKNSGAKTCYEARRNSPRNGNPNPNIFHFRKNLAQELWEKGYGSGGPQILSAFDLGSSERKERIEEYLRLRDSLVRSSSELKKGWRGALGMLEDIATDFDPSVGVEIFTRTSWRVNGEVKRHRTMPQIGESIYNAVGRAEEFVGDEENLAEVFSMPNFVRENEEAYKMWVWAFDRSLGAYSDLLDLGVMERDAIAVVPRGVKLGVFKHKGLYNLTAGYDSLRLCKTAEPEMRKLTEAETRAVKMDNRIGSDVKSLLGPKCYATGFCPETVFGKSCQKVLAVNQGYDIDFHDRFMDERGSYIAEQLDEY